jgi:hypothetical protein
MKEIGWREMRMLMNEGKWIKIREVVENWDAGE